MNVLLSVNWIAISVLAITLLLFYFLHFLSKKIKWIYVMLLAIVLGAIVGIVFQSPSNEYLVWLNVIGQVYIKIITALVAPVILLSVIAGLIQLNDKEKMKNIGFTSVLWLLIASVVAIFITFFIGAISNVGAGAGSVFSNLSTVTSNEISAYSEYGKSLDAILISLVPNNVLNDLANDNVVAIIIIALAVSLAYVSISEKEGEGKLAIIKELISASKDIVFRILSFVIKQTPYAVLCLMAYSASSLLSDREALIQLAFLIALIFICCLIQTYIANGIVIKVFAKLSPVKFFRKIADAQITAFTTSSSVGTLPVATGCLIKRVGVEEEVANFTAPLGTTMGMAGCSCVWPILLVMFYINATGITWSPSQYIIVAFMCMVLSLGSAGMPGVGVIMAVSMFSAVNLPIAAVVLLMPINNITDMIRTMNNVTNAAVAATVVARKNNLLHDSVFNDEEGFIKENIAVAEVG